MATLIKAAFLVLILTNCRISKNLHVVEDGKLYRSAQLTGKEFEQAIEKLEIKTIINLRGENVGKPWYDEEVESISKHGVTHINIGMSAGRLPHSEDLAKLMEAFEFAERPILIHCQGGADRTGEASAIYKMEYMGKSKKTALKQLTLKYLHIKKKAPSKRYFIDKIYQRGIDWAMYEYDPCKHNYKYYDRKYCQ